MKSVQGDLYINRPLTTMSLAVIQAQSEFVAPQIFPRVPSEVQSASYYKFDEAAFNRDSMKKRAPGTRAELIQYSISKDTFFADVWSIAHAIPDEDRVNAESVLQLDTQANELLVRAALIRQEKMFVDAFFKAGVWTNYDWAGVSGTPSAASSEVLQWDDADSDPIENVANARMAIKAATGYKPNTMVVGMEVDAALQKHPLILARIQYGGTPGAPALVTKAALAAIFQVNTYLVMEAIEDSSHQGATSDTDFIGGKKAWLGYVASNPGQRVASAGYTFVWSGLTGNNTLGYRIKKFREEPEASDVIQIDMAMDMKITAPKLGAFWDTVVS